MGNKSLYLKPSGGLGNRMLAIASAVTLSRETERSLTILWERDEQLNCPFHLLFESIPTCQLQEQYTFMPLIRKLKRHLSHLSYSKVLHRETLNELVADERLLNELALHQRVLIYGAHQFYPIASLKTLFTPIATIQNRVEAITRQFTKETIGIHIRRTDHTPSKTKSPTTLFIEKMKKAIQKNQLIKFYLTTDDPAEEEQLLSQFGSNIISQSREYNRNSIKGIQDALVDLLCLAHCSKIYGSFYSSFSYTAAQFGSGKLIVLNNSNAPIDHLRHLRKPKQ